MIVRSPRYTIPVEVKYRRADKLGLKDGLVIFCEQERVPQAYLVTQREQDFGVVRFADMHTHFLRVPAHIFTYLLGQAERLLWKH